MKCVRAQCMKSTTWRVWNSRPTHDVFQHYLLILRHENEIVQVQKWQISVAKIIQFYLNDFLCNFCRSIRRCVDKIHDFYVFIVLNVAIVLNAMETCGEFSKQREKKTSLNLYKQVKWVGEGIHSAMSNAFSSLHNEHEWDNVHRA